VIGSLGNSTSSRCTGIELATSRPLISTPSSNLSEMMQTMFPRPHSDRPTRRSRSTRSSCLIRNLTSPRHRLRPAALSCRSTKESSQIRLSRRPRYRTSPSIALQGRQQELASLAERMRKRREVHRWACSRRTLTANRLRLITVLPLDNYKAERQQ
jgi:hypothetical protein